MDLKDLKLGQKLIVASKNMNALKEALKNAPHQIIRTNDGYEVIAPLSKLGDLEKAAKDMGLKIKSASNEADKTTKVIFVKADLDNDAWRLVFNNLRYLYNVYQNLHWLSKGNSFYGDHLLFERLYKKLLEEVDQVAERLIGLNFELPELQSLASVMTSHATLELAISLESELSNRLQELESKVDSLGVKDLFGSLASSRQESLYLLGQRVKKD